MLVALYLFLSKDGDSMKMTLEEYIKNPMGKENAVFSQREMFRNLYEQKFSKVMLREAGLLKYRLFKDGDSRWIIHLKIPSEVVPKFYYDTVIEFTSINPIHILAPTLKDYNAKFYSNDPAFVFTFAHSFNKNGLFIEDLLEKMSKQAIEDKAKIKNPKDVVGYVKSIYFAYLYIKGHGLDKKAAWVADSRPYDKNLLLAFIQQADAKVADRQRLGVAHDKETKAPKKKIDTGARFASEKTVNAVKTVKTVGTVKRVGSVKTVSRTKRK